MIVPMGRPHLLRVDERPRKRKEMAALLPNKGYAVAECADPRMGSLSVAAPQSTLTNLVLSRVATRETSHRDGIDIVDRQRRVGAAALLDMPASCAVALLERISEGLKTHIGPASQFDSIATMAIRRLPVSAP